MRCVTRSMLRCSQRGFTLIELLVVMGLFAVMAGMITVNLVKPQATASVSGSVNEMVADLKSQQLRAMMGDSGSGITAQPHGIYVQPGQYTLFKGSSYNGSDADNSVIPAKNGVTLSATFPSSQVVFSKGSGEVSGFSNGANVISVQSSATGEVTQITLNRLGAISVN
jgi:prepilin-type N-terminal cleavage/methylation domain-containing protein